MGGWPNFRADEPPGGPADEYRALLEEALRCVDEGETALRARLLSQLAEQISMETRESHSQAAVALAREAGDPDALFGALYSRLAALLGPGDVRHRLEVATELLDLAIRCGSKEKVFVARESRIRSLLALGDIAGADREIDSCHDLAEELRVPIYRHSVSRFRLARALGDGRLDEAERLNREILALGARTDDTSAELVFGVLTGWIQYLRGDLPSMRELIEGLLERVAFIGPISLAFAAFLHAELDEPEAARRQLERMSGADFSDVPPDEAWLMTLAVAAEACAHLGDRQRARTLYDLLAPYADLIVSHQHLRVYLGSVEYVLGRLAEALEERERAADHYQAAMESSRRIGARPHLARTEYAYARMLLGADSISADEEGRARDLLGHAEATARELGMKRLLELVRATGRGRRSCDRGGC
jgi:tetratricopeptide (TPR) repeat protein